MVVILISRHWPVACAGGACAAGLDFRSLRATWV